METHTGKSKERLLDNLDINSRIDTTHRLRRNQDELLAHRTSSRLNHHSHTDLPIDRIHEDVKFIETANRRAHCIPQRKQQADGRKRLLTTRKRHRLASFILLQSVIWLDFQIQFLFLVVCQQLAPETAFAEEIHELDASTGCDVLLEHFPSVFAIDERVFQKLCEFLDALDFFTGLVELFDCFPCSVDELVPCTSNPIFMLGTSRSQTIVVGGIPLVSCYQVSIKLFEFST